MKTIGPINTTCVECINKRLNKYRIRWEFEPYYNEIGIQEGVVFYEAELLHKPTLDDIRNVIIKHYNKEIDEQILNGFSWNGYDVYLSIENQFNYKAAYDLAIQTHGANLPIKFKFGTMIYPKYYTFTSIDELSDFYMSAVNYINDTLSKGWEQKDSIDWSEYEKYC